jgi:hypothetical protein
MTVPYLTTQMFMSSASFSVVRSKQQPHVLHSGLATGQKTADYGVRLPEGVTNVSLYHSFHTGYGVNPAYAMGIAGVITQSLQLHGADNVSQPRPKSQVRSVR